MLESVSYLAVVSTWYKIKPSANILGPCSDLDSVSMLQKLKDPPLCVESKKIFLILT